MAINEKMEKALNEQINKELFSAYLYQSMAAYFESKSLKGFANWLDVQASEEKIHARKIYDFINERGGRVLLKAIEEPKHDWDNVQAAFKDALAHEQFITDSINKLVDLAIELSDHATNNFLQWFVAEQVEEEATATEIVDRLELIDENVMALLRMDESLGVRTLTATSEE
ncbi:ferritin [Oceanotoga sp. DSM 15011]|jgi:ferritin|uniref:ferritin n=1 Tax=Oceanotoga TaxID=1255275 RepID=UPI0021F49CFA|nr:MULTISPECIES: ferritin [Oceanotoga]MDN5341631.1 ferritin [Oceanotoga sp.]MDO7977166.1 ferritin [Oceanotoga teriensis]UYP00263.1 ferritin [Oceanotoga sp. DSM 15011]